MVTLVVYVVTGTGGGVVTGHVILEDFSKEQAVRYCKLIERTLMCKYLSL